MVDVFSTLVEVMITSVYMHLSKLTKMYILNVCALFCTQVYNSTKLKKRTLCGVILKGFKISEFSKVRGYMTKTKSQGISICSQ